MLLQTVKISSLGALIPHLSTPPIAIAIQDAYLVVEEQSVLSFTALLEHSNTIVRCIVINLNTVVSTVNSALVLVQGEPFSVTEISLLYILYRSPVSCW